MCKIWLMMSLLPVLASGEVCFGHLGCFVLHPSLSLWKRGLHLAPWTPRRIHTNFLLYTKQNPETFQELVAVNPQTIKDSNFKLSQKSRFIIHGFHGSGRGGWTANMCKAMLQVEDVNCICVDWHGGSRTLYDQAAANIRVVGAEVAYFIQSLQINFSYPLSNIHLIGHSLGAHTAGLAGGKLPGIGRITGLDPADPLFQEKPPQYRLDSSDALLVDVIHTDTSSLYKNLGFAGYGMMEPIGHLDFYPNGGKRMPGCGRFGLDVKRLIACNHLRAYQYYTESITNPDGFLAYPASSYKAFQKGAGFPCRNGECPMMGHSAANYSRIINTAQLFYLNTGARKTFARWRYKVTTNIAARNGVSGSFYVSLQGSKGATKLYKIYKGRMTRYAECTTFLDSEIDVGNITKVTIIFRGKGTRTGQFRASSVTVESGNGSVYSFYDHKIAKLRSGAERPILPDLQDLDHDQD